MLVTGVQPLSRSAALDLSTSHLRGDKVIFVLFFCLFVYSICFVFPFSHFCGSQWIGELMTLTDVHNPCRLTQSLGDEPIPNQICIPLSNIRTLLLTTELALTYSLTLPLEYSCKLFQEAL